EIEITSDVQKIQESLMTGFVMIQVRPDDNVCVLVPAPAKANRQVTIPEVEYSVLGPKEAFVEALDTNLNMVRKRLPIPELQMKELNIGSLTKTKVAVLYINGIANEQNVNTIVQRIQDVQYDQIVDSSFIRQMIVDNKNSPFPQLVDTERPDRIASVLAEGKIAVMVDGSPQVFYGPTTLIEFFSSTEDYFLTWHIASAVRLMRLLAVTLSVIATPLYVAVLTHHYQMIPDKLLDTLIASRSGIPFPPILETIVLELTIELLREAGARLPTKVGQTIGIVGGIVIGTAAVQAGITSNVLLIIVALSALASFTTPVYQVSFTIRAIRFPFLLFAQFWGLLGVSMCFAFFVSHLLRLTSLGNPYIEPVYPLRLKDLKDGLIRLPFSMQKTRPKQLRPENPIRFRDEKKEETKQQANFIVKWASQKDIDEF
ncbi:spore germination protein, partial [Fictibacillus sp. Mic-4]|uniref:spore germination protein n=1 Tax=Fictibacillus sp. Mic-4 TaxID=3132826 RepID=UPI003CFB1FD6